MSGFRIYTITAVVDDGLREVTCCISGSDRADAIRGFKVVELKTD